MFGKSHAHCMCDDPNKWRVTMLIRNIRDLGGFLRRAREDLGLTQAALAETLGVCRQRVLYLERGEGQLQTAFVFAVLKTLDLEVSFSPVSARVQRAKPADLAPPYSIDDIADGGK